MKYWSVTMHVDATGYAVVKAETEEEAREIGFDEYDPDNTEIGDPVEVTDCVELTEEEFEKYRK